MTPPALRRIAGCLLIALCVWAPESSAHLLAPSLLEVHQQADGQIDVRWKTPLVRAAGAELQPELPPHCRMIGGGTVKRSSDAATAIWRMDCGERGLRGSTVAVRGLEASGTDALVRVVGTGRREVRVLLSGGRPAFVVPERVDRYSILRDYVWLGCRHISSGLDHLFFLGGLMLLVGSRRRLLLTLTAFTLGHSTTLSLAALGWVEFPAALVEVAIAASVLALGLELSRDEPKPSALARRPWALAIGFGLLHGMGFAAALAEVGLPSEEIPMALLAFNLGIELGQLAWVALGLAVVWLSRRRYGPLPAPWSRLPAYAIGSTAVFWLLDRVSSWL